MLRWPPKISLRQTVRTTIAARTYNVLELPPAIEASFSPHCLPHLEISGTVLAVLTPFMPRPSIANPDIVPRMGPGITMPKRYDTAIMVPVI